MNRIETLRLLFREIGILGIEASTRLARVLPRNLTETQFGLLNHLHFTTNVDETPADLARAFKVSRPAMTQILRRLVDRGFVELRPAPGDGRLRHVTLTAAGDEAHEAVLEALGKDFEAMATHSSAGELADLLTALRHFRQTVEAVPVAGPAGEDVA
jgi:DNA-binding MarR family transcriptional regulator